jgi:alpha-glucan,water dikinase
VPQAIRDEILVIMRKFEIKKRKGTWMEEWHQKLHNNSTPDDIPICEAYIRFLESDGDLTVFYSYLESKGINRKRLQTYERPILQEPVFFPSVKNGLINELSKYLQILKRVHSGADLFRCVDFVRGYVGDELLAHLNAVLANLENHDQLLPLLHKVLTLKLLSIAIANS